MGYHPLVDFHSFSLTERFPITPSTIYPIGKPSTFCIDKTVHRFLDVIPFQLLDVAIFVVVQLNFGSLACMNERESSISSLFTRS